MAPETIYGLFLLVGNIVFIGIYAWVYRGINKQKFEDAAHIPFQEDERYE